MKFCSISTATSVVSPKYGPRTRNAGNASTKPASTEGHRAQEDAQIDRPAIIVVEDAGGVGADADQEGRPEIHLAREPEQQVPGHREHAEIIGDRQQAEHVAGDVERQGRRDDDHDQRDQE